MNYSVKSLSTEDFEYNKELRLFTAPLSKWNGSYWSKIYLTNPKTNKSVYLYLVKSPWCGSKRYRNTEENLTLVLLNNEDLKRRENYGKR